MFDQEFAEVGEIFVGQVQGLLLGVAAVELLLLLLLALAWRSNCVEIVQVDVFARTCSIFSHLLIATTAAERIARRRLLQLRCSPGASDSLISFLICGAWCELALVARCWRLGVDLHVDRNLR